MRVHDDDFNENKKNKKIMIHVDTKTYGAYDGLFESACVQGASVSSNTCRSIFR